MMMLVLEEEAKGREREIVGRYVVVGLWFVLVAGGEEGAMNR